MQTKPSWTITNDKGEKYFWYDNMGWIDSRTGCVADNVQDMHSTPSDATHVMIHRGAVGYVRKTATDYCLQNERGEWVCCGGDINGISGTVIRLSDGYVAKRDCGPHVMPETPCDAEGWHVHGATSARPNEPNLRVEIEYSNGARSFGLVRNFNWANLGSLGDIVRWRYAA